MRISLFHIAFVIALAGCVFLAQDGFGQSKKQLEKQRADFEERIRQTQKVLEETRKNADSSLGQLKALNEQIKQSQDLTENLKKEQELLTDEVDKVSAEVDSLENEFNRIKQEYGEALYHFSKAHGEVNTLALLFASESLEQLVARLDYLKLYQKSRKKQILEILQLKSELDSTRKNLEFGLKEKSDLISKEEFQIGHLNELLEQQQTLRTSLQKEVNDLQRQLYNQKEALKRLERTISRNIKSSSEATATEKAEKPKTNEKPASIAFESLKSELEWPVKEGFISGRFGKQPHPVLQGVFIENLGVDIRTNPKSAVRAVFEGKVTAVTKVPGMNYMVMVQHDDYFTVYAKLARVKVKSGQKVNAQTIVGYPAENEEGVHELQFQIWKQQYKLNPEEWLKK